MSRTGIEGEALALKHPHLDSNFNSTIRHTFFTGLSFTIHIWKVVMEVRGAETSSGWVADKMKIKKTQCQAESSFLAITTDIRT